jgi:hypothetical protein
MKNPRVLLLCTPVHALAAPVTLSEGSVTGPDVGFDLGPNVGLR